jgi:hypothetical protein
MLFSFAPTAAVFPFYFLSLDEFTHLDVADSRLRAAIDC